MASIIKKINKGRTYYYYTEFKRINGKSKYYNQVYLGTAEKVLARIMDNKKNLQPLYSKLLDFGDIMSLYDIASRLGICDIIDENIKKRNQEASISIRINPYCKK